MLKLHLQLSSQRKRLYQEAIRRLQHVCVCDEGSPDGRIVGPEDISGEHPIPCLVDQPEKIAEDHLMARVQGVPAHPFAVIEHPIATASDEGLDERAQEAVKRAVEVLIA